MEALEETLRRAHDLLNQVEDDGESAPRLIGLLEDAGAQLGYLQVACCSPARIKLYTEALASLGAVQRLITRILDLEH